MTDETPLNRDAGEVPKPVDEVTRRQFVAGGVALGAVVVWTSPFPFADAAIGQILSVEEAHAANGPTGPTGAGPAPEEPEAQPRARINVPDTVRIGRRGKFFVGIRCIGDQPLVGSARLQGIVRSSGGTRREVLSPLSRRVSLGRSRFRVAPGRHKRIQIRLTRNGRRLLRRRGKLTVRLIIKTAGRRPQRRRLKLVSAL